MEMNYCIEIHVTFSDENRSRLFVEKRNTFRKLFT